MNRNVMLSICCLLLSVISTASTIQKNDSQELNELISDAIKNRSEVKLQKGRTYKVDKGIRTIVLKQGEKLIIDGNGAKIEFLANTGTQLSYLFHVKSEEFNANGYFSLRNLSIDGISNPVQFDGRQYEKLRLAVPIFTERIGEVNLEALNMSNIYGAGARVNVFQKFSANKLRFEKVGGKWHKTDDFDAFGDALYLAYARNNATAVIENCHLEGYPVSPHLGGWKDNLSRCGIVAEYNPKNLLTLKVSNTNLIGYHRSIHVEASKTELHVDNSTFERFGCGIFTYGYEAKDVYVNNSKFIDNVDSFFGGAKGIVTGYANKNRGFVTNSKIITDNFFRNNEMNVVYRNSDFQFSRYSKPNRSASFFNCTISTPLTLAADFGKLDAKTERSQSSRNTSSGFIVRLLNAIFK